MHTTFAIFRYVSACFRFVADEEAFTSSCLQRTPFRVLSLDQAHKKPQVAKPRTSQQFLHVYVIWDLTCI